MGFVPIELEAIEGEIALKQSQLASMAGPMQELSYIIKDIEKDLPQLIADAEKAKKQYKEVVGDTLVSLQNYKLAVRVVHTTEDVVSQARFSKAAAESKLKDFKKAVLETKDHLAYLHKERSEWNQVLKFETKG